MNLIADAPIWLAAILFAALVAAAVEDFVRLKISNITCLVVLVAAVIAVLLQGFSAALWQNAVVFLVLLGVGYVLFATNKMGGGDVKFLASLGLWVDIGAAVWLVITTLLAGGLLAIIYLVVRYGRASGTGKKYQSKGIPYGIAIAAGATLIFSGQLGLFKSTPERPRALELRPLS